MKKRIAVWHNIKHNYDAFTESWPEGSKEWYRKSEYIEVDFHMLPEPAMSHEAYDYE